MRDDAEQPERIDDPLRGEFQPAAAPRAQVQPGDRHVRGGDGVVSTDLAEGLLAKTFVDAGIRCEQHVWNRLCKSFVAQCKRSKFISR